MLVALLGLAALSSRGSATDQAAPIERARREVDRSLDYITQYQSRGDPEHALQWAEHADAIARQALDPGDPDRTRAAQALIGLRCRDAMRRGDPRTALGLAREARDAALKRPDLKTAAAWAEYMVQVAERSLPAGDPARVQALLALAGVQYGRKDSAAALRLYERAAAEAEQEPEGNARARVEALVNMTWIRFERGEGAEAPAARVLAEVGRIAGPGDLLAVQAQRLVALHVWTPMLGRAAKVASAGGAAVAAGEAQLRRDLKRFGATLRAAHVDPAWASLGLLWLAKFQFDHQRIDAARATLAKLAATVGDPRVGPAMMADYWTLLGLVEDQRGNTAQARDAHETALRICRQADLPQQVLALNNLGLLLLRQGDYAAARKPLQKAAELYAQRANLKDDPGQVYTLTNLAKAYEGDGNYRFAERLHRKALARAEAAAPPDLAAQCLCRNNLGITLYDAGRFTEARDEFERARALAQRAFGATHFRVAETDVNLGWVALALDRSREAEARFRAARATFRAELGEDHRRTAEVLGYLARVLAQDGRGAEARSVLEKAATLRERYLRRTLRAALSERDRLAFVQELRVHPESSAWPGVLDTYLDLAPQLHVPVEDQYRRLLTWKGVIARHALPRAEELEDDPEVRDLARRREEVLGKLRTVSLTTARADHPEQREADLAAWEAEADALERQLRARSRRFDRQGAASDLAPGQVAAALPPGSALLDVIEIRRYRRPKRGETVGTRDGRYIAFLVRPGRPLVRIDLGDAPAVDAAVRAFHRALELGSDTFSEPAARVAALIRSPLAAYLERVEVLIVAADGLLYQLPLAALPGRRPGTFWIDDLAFASVPSAQSLVVRRLRARPATTGLLSVGGIDYGTAAAGGKEWPPLPATRDEAEAVARAFRASHPSQPVDLLTGMSATKTVLRDLLPRRRFIHLATHGYFTDMGSGRVFDPYGLLAQLDSGLVLAGANQGGAAAADQVLTAEELGQLDLRGVDLVVLSACESGLGHVSAGQGVIGLLGALDRAGAAAVIGALWKVDDDATAALMAAFYRHLWSGPNPAGPARALQAAQRELIRSTRQTRAGDPLAHPRNWAAFVLGGDPAARPSR